MIPIDVAQMSDNMQLRDRRPMTSQLGDALRDRIRNEMQAGDQIPTEHALAAEYAVSRATVREALKLLEQEGLLDVRHGRGRFVAAAPAGLVNRPITTFESLTEMLEGMGYHATNRVVSAKLVRPTSEEASALDIAEDVDVVRLVRVYEAEERPLIVSVNTFAASLLGDEALDDVDFRGSLDLWLAHHGRQPQSSIAQIRAEQLPSRLADLPRAEAKAPWISITERCLDATGAAVLFARDFHRGDIFTFHVLRRRS